MSQPRKLLTATTEKTPIENSTQWLSTSPTIEIGTILAIMLPTMPCAKTKGASGSFTRAPAVASAIDPSSGPSSSAAGAWTWISKAATATDAAINAAHCAVGGSEPRVQLLFMIREAYCTNSSASPFILCNVSINSAAAAASRASSVPRNTSDTLTLPLRKPG